MQHATKGAFGRRWQCPGQIWRHPKVLKYYTSLGFSSGAFPRFFSHWLASEVFCRSVSHEDDVCLYGHFC